MSKITYPRTAAELRALISMGIDQVKALLKANGLKINLRAFMQQFYKERQLTKQELEQINQSQLAWQQERDAKGQSSAVMLYHCTGAKELAGFRYEKLDYVKKDRAQYDKERKKDWDKARKVFLIKIATDPETKEQLLEAGVPTSEIQKMAEGYVPVIDGKGYQVHHRIPLDDGGNNNFSNLILIRDSYEHRSVHGAYNPAEKAVKLLKVGECTTVAYPVPPADTLIYPNPKKGYESKQVSNADFLDMIK
jgi:hypothetical protein